MKRVFCSLFLILMSGTVSLVCAETFFDDFNRANTGPVMNGADIGTGYILATVGGIGTVPASIVEKQFKLNGEGPKLRTLSYQGFQAENTAGKSFEASVDIILANYAQTVNVGMVFNLQDEKNFYWVRIVSSTESGGNDGILQFGQVVNGAVAAFTDAAIKGLNLQTKTVYSLSIASSKAGAFEYTLTGGTLNLSGARTDNVGDVDFLNGYVGLYAANSSGQPVFDNFSVTTHTDLQVVGFAELLTVGKSVAL